MSVSLVPQTEVNQIVSNIRAGNVQGLEDLKVSFGSMIKRLLMRHAGEDWEEYFTDVLYAVWDGIRRNGMENPAALPGFVKTIAIRTGGKHFERAKRYSSLEDAVETGAVTSGRPSITMDHTLACSKPNPEQQYAAVEKIHWISWGLHYLPELERSLIRMFYLEGRSHEDIQAELNLTDNNYRLRKSRAKKRLAEIIQTKMERIQNNPNIGNPLIKSLENRRAA